MRMPGKNDCIRMFELTGGDDILEEQHFGIINGRITTNVLKSNVLSFRTLFAPPFASSNFMLEGRVLGELVRTREYTWRPNEVLRKGRVNKVEVRSELLLIEGERTAILKVVLRNSDGKPLRIPLCFEITGGMDYVTDWLFARPTANKPCWTEDQGSLLRRRNDTGEIAIGATIEKMHWEDYSTHWTGEVAIQAGQEKMVYLVIGIGADGEAQKIVRTAMKNPAEMMDSSRRAWARRVGELLDRLPRFAAADKRLERFYYRSILHFILNQWQVDEFVLRPFYSTGSINGGSVCSYLWDFGEGWEIFSLADPMAMREHIKAFLKIDLTRHFSFNPLNGAGWGPWYYINQEKIVFLIYYYVMLSGDEGFLQEVVNGRSVIEWVVFHTMVGDRGGKEANLVDYGAGNHHLELRREYRYDHLMPDLNLRRIPIYRAAGHLCKVAGYEAGIHFNDRANKLKILVRRRLWSAKDQWWVFEDPRGNRQLRYTMQMFKVIGSGAINSQEERALVDHINEEEFLSEFGMHSMSKLDPAYDQVDIDNGGGGACCCFPPQIAERLYKAGYPHQAEDILRRILWWGDRLPYWSDSLVANAMDYRKDTPLQNAIGAVAGAQAIVFGMFGIEVKADGEIVVDPHPPEYSSEMALEGVRIRGLSIDVRVSGDGDYQVKADGRLYREKVGKAVRIDAPNRQGDSSLA